MKCLGFIFTFIVLLSSGTVFSQLSFEGARPRFSINQNEFPVVAEKLYGIVSEIEVARGT